MNEDRIEFYRPTWAEYYLGMASDAAKRSHDAETKHGCIITDAKHRVVSVGYNGFPREVNDNILPNIRPKKYPWMKHAEKNALANCLIIPENGIAYITGRMCNDCMTDLWQKGVKEVFELNRKHPVGTCYYTPDQEQFREEFLQATGMKVTLFTVTKWMLENYHLVPNVVLPDGV